MAYGKLSIDRSSVFSLEMSGKALRKRGFFLPEKSENSLITILNFNMC